MATAHAGKPPQALCVWLQPYSRSSLLSLSTSLLGPRASGCILTLPPPEAAVALYAGGVSAISPGSRSATPGHTSEWVPTPEELEIPLQPLRGKFPILIETRGALRDPGLIAAIPPG